MTLWNAKFGITCLMISRTIIEEVFHCLRRILGNLFVHSWLALQVLFSSFVCDALMYVGTCY